MLWYILCQDRYFMTVSYISFCFFWIFFYFYFQEMHNKSSFYASWFILRQERVLSSLLRWSSPPRLEDWSSMLTRTVNHCLRWSREIMAKMRLLVTWKAWPRGTSSVDWDLEIFSWFHCNEDCTLVVLHASKQLLVLILLLDIEVREGVGGKDQKTEG